MSSAFDRIANPVEAALFDADPTTYQPPTWQLDPWHLAADGHVDA